MSETSQDELTIEQLAQRAGMTVRNIRAHQSRGLLPPPEVRARTGYYGPEHLARLELIRQMQADGFNLEAIRRLLDGAQGVAGEVLGFRQAVLAPFEREQPEIIDAVELADRFGPDVPQKVLQRAVKLGVIVPLPDGRFEIPSPTLLAAGEELRKLGVPRQAGLEALESVQRHSRSVAEAFAELFLAHVWKPFERDDLPDERWTEVRDALDRLRPLASEVLLAVFAQTMSRTVEKRFGEQLRKLNK